jgi:sulfur relay (sulfurtransferase) complex TusBCD TusD component (DsrE family)
MTDKQQDETTHCEHGTWLYEDICLACKPPKDEQAELMHGRDQICRHGHILYCCTGCARNRGMAEGERAATERIIWIIERLGDGYENQHGKEREVIDDVLYEIREGRAQ